MGAPYAKRDRPLLMRLIAPLFTLVIKGIQDVRVSGDGALPATGPLIIASNHTNHFDGPVLAAVLCERPLGTGAAAAGGGGLSARRGRRRASSRRSARWWCRLAPRALRRSRSTRRL